MVMKPDDIMSIRKHSLQRRLLSRVNGIYLTLDAGLWVRFSFALISD